MIQVLSKLPGKEDSRHGLQVSRRIGGGMFSSSGNAVFAFPWYFMMRAPKAIRRASADRKEEIARKNRLLFFGRAPTLSWQSRFWPAFIYPSGPGRFVTKTTKKTSIVRHAPDLRAKNLSLEARMAIGTVKWFNPTKGFGFIQPENGTNDVFVHISAVNRAGLGTLNEGQRVSYNVVSERGKQAADDLKTV